MEQFLQIWCSILDTLDQHGIDTIACELHGDDMKSADLRLPAAYLIGNEGKGLKAETIERCSRKIKIPMRMGIKDRLWTLITLIDTTSGAPKSIPL